MIFPSTAREAGGLCERSHSSRIIKLLHNNTSLKLLLPLIFCGARFKRFHLDSKFIKGLIRRFFFFMYNSRVNLLERTVIGELENRWKIFFFHSQSWMKILSKLLIGKYFKTFRANLSPCNLYSSLYTSVKIGSEIWILIGSSFREINDFNSFATSDFFAAHGIRERSSMAAFTPHCKPKCFHDVRKKNFPRIIYNTLAFNYTLESNNITEYNNNC